MQATRAFRWAGDKLAIGAGGSFGASSNKGAEEINSFNGAGPATLFLSIVTSPLFPNWSGDDREIDNTSRAAPSSQTQSFACYVFPKQEVLAILLGRNKHRPGDKIKTKQPIACVHLRPHELSLCVCLPEWLGFGCGLADTVHHNALITPSCTMLHLALGPQHSIAVERPHYVIGGFDPLHGVDRRIARTASRSAHCATF
jgi:hypothetical protein